MRGEYDEAIKVAGDIKRRLIDRLSILERHAIEQAFDSRQISYAYKSSDEAALEAAAQWIDTAHEFFTGHSARRVDMTEASEVERYRQVGMRYHEARAKLTPEQIDQVDKLYVGLYGTPVDHEMVIYAEWWSSIAEDVLRDTTSGGLGGSSPQDVEEPVENPLVLIIQAIQNNDGGWQSHCSCGWISATSSVNQADLRAVIIEHSADHQQAGRTPAKAKPEEAGAAPVG